MPTGLWRFALPTALLLLGGAAATAWTSPGAPDPAPGPAPRADRTAACSRPAPTSAAGWNAAFDRLGDRFAAGDQATSVPLPDGRVLWLFDDTLQGTRTPAGGVRDWRMPHNTLVLSERGCLSVHTGPGQRSLIPEAADGQHYWPMSAVLDGGRLYVFSMRVRSTDDWFVGTGMELAQLSYAPGAVPRFERMRRTPSTGTPETRVQWGAAATRSGGWTYVYGTRRVDRPLVFGKELYVARVPAGRLADLAAWRYWDGGAWARTGAAAIHPAVGGVSTTLSVHHLGDRWVAVTKKDDMLGSDVVALTGPTPAGPWTEQLLTRAPSNAATGDITYSVMAHPSLALRSGRLLVSICRNNLDPAKVLADVERGQPEFVEVDLRG